MRTIIIALVCFPSASHAGRIYATSGYSDAARHARVIQERSLNDYRRTESHGSMISETQGHPLLDELTTVLLAYNPAANIRSRSRARRVGEHVEALLDGFERREIFQQAAALGAVLAHRAFIPAATASTPDDLPEILEKAEEGTLSAPPVLARARKGDIIDPASVQDCTQLANLIAVDTEARYELLPAARSYVQFKQMTEDDMSESMKGMLQGMLKDADVTQDRIDTQLNGLQNEYNKRSCGEVGWTGQQ